MKVRSVSVTASRSAPPINKPEIRGLGTTSFLLSSGTSCRPKDQLVQLYKSSCYTYTPPDYKQMALQLNNYNCVELNG